MSWPRLYHCRRQFQLKAFSQESRDAGLATAATDDADGLLLATMVQADSADIFVSGRHVPPC